MASIRHEFVLEVPADRAWAALRDVGQAHRLFAGVLSDCRMEGEGARIVTFANGLVAKELIVDIDDAARRLAYAVTGGPPTHHNASMQVFAEGEWRSRVVWITDMLPHDFKVVAGPLMEAGAAAMKRSLETVALTSG